MKKIAKKILKSRRVFGGRLIDLYLERRTFPNGYTADLEVVRHPGAVLIVPFVDEGKVVLIRQYRPVIDSYIWELPAGTLHRGEAHLDCARREMREEIGYSARRWARLGYIYPAPGYTTEKILIFKAEALAKVESRGEEDEIISAKVFSKKGVAKLLKKGKIVDAKTICALALSGVLSHQGFLRK